MKYIIIRRYEHENKYNRTYLPLSSWVNMYVCSFTYVYIYVSYLSVNMDDIV